MNETFVQRMRVTFATDDTVMYVGHLDMARTWERAIRRARLPLAYTQGFNPQARLHFAAALPVGFTGSAELADVFLNEALSPADFVLRLSAALPAGIRILAAAEVGRELPSLQSATLTADYLVEVETTDDVAGVAEKVEAFMRQEEAWRTRRRGRENKPYDLRALVLWARCLGASPSGVSLVTGMSCRPGATGRPDELLTHLGYGEAPRSIARLALHLDPAGMPAVAAEPASDGGPQDGALSATE